jgi:hypothetical protein
MSTYPQYTLQSQDVYKLTINTLDTLPLSMPGVSFLADESPDNDHFHV